MALTSPPTPGFDPQLQGVIRTLRLIPVEGELVRLDGYTLTVESADAGGARWAIEQGAPPSGFAPRLLTKQAANAIRDGKVMEDGTIAWSGWRWALRDTWDGARLVADVTQIQRFVQLGT